MTASAERGEVIYLAERSVKTLPPADSDSAIVMFARLSAYMILTRGSAGPGYQDFRFPEEGGLERRDKQGPFNVHITWIATQTAGKGEIRMEWDVVQKGKLASVRVHTRTDDPGVNITALENKIFAYLESAPGVRRIASGR